jgi:hypothetical protein
MQDMPYKAGKLAESQLGSEGQEEAVQSTFQVVKEAERLPLGAQQVITRQTPLL